MEVYLHSIILVLSIITKVIVSLIFVFFNLVEQNQLSQRVNFN